MKTIFYKLSDDKDNADSWLDNQPYKIWFNLEGFLYEPNRDVEALFITKEKYVKHVDLTTRDYFSDSGIIRKIYANIQP